MLNGCRCILTGHKQSSRIVISISVISAICGSNSNRLESDLAKLFE